MFNVLIDCSKDFGNLVGFIKNIIFAIKIAAPVILIVLGGLDFVKATMSQKDDEISKAKKKFINRIMMACGVFLLLTGMELINNLLSSIGIESEWLSCWGLK